jgi:peptidoglycan hydrolase CwlO-like protein
MTAWTLLDAQNWITDNADAITSTNNDISDLSERIDNIEEDISLLQNL